MRSCSGSAAWAARRCLTWPGAACGCSGSSASTWPRVSARPTAHPDIRLAYWEHPTYVALLRRAYELWRELEESRRRAAPPHHRQRGRGARKRRRSSRARCGSSRAPRPGPRGDGRRRAAAGAFPATACPTEIGCLYQPEGGFLLPERCDVAHVEQALALGAEVQCRERGARLGGERRAGPGADEPGRLRGRAPRHLSRGPGHRSSSPSWRPRGARAPGARLAPADPARALPAGGVPGLQPGGRGGALLRLPQLPHPRLQVRQVSPPRRAGGSRHRGPGPRARGRGAAPRGLRAALFPGGGGPDAHSCACMFTNTPGPALHPGPAPGPAARSRSRPGSPATATSSAAWSGR